jgi:hypothetical protein
MHIEIEGDESISRQARTYAEYRLFAALAPSIDDRRCTSASLVVRRARNPRRGAPVVCTVAVDLQGSGVARFRAAGAHPYEAINRAVERVRRKSWSAARAPRAEVG